MTVLIFLAVLFVLVLVHEWGHFIAAKKTGMRVDEFGIGFPPRLFRIRKGETLYSFNLLPIGGFVKIFGEDAVDAEHAPDRERSFVAKSKIRQSVVLVAGVVMNVLLAWFLFSVALGIGVQSAVSESDASDEAELVVTDVLPGSPADEAGLQAGLVIIRAVSDGEMLNTPSPSSFSTFVDTHQDGAITLTYMQGGETFDTMLTPRTGVIAGESDRPAVGVALSFIDVVRRPLHEAVGEGFMLTMRTLRDITAGISLLIWDALRLSADLSQVAGPVGIVELVGEASAFGISALLMFTAFISLNLAVINLLPFPALDGGRLLFVFVEVLKGSPIRPYYVQVLNTVGFALLIILMVAVTYNDIARMF